MSRLDERVVCLSSISSVLIQIVLCPLAGRVIVRQTVVIAFRLLVALPRVGLVTLRQRFVRRCQNCGAWAAIITPRALPERSKRRVSPRCRADRFDFLERHGL